MATVPDQVTDVRVGGWKAWLAPVAILVVGFAGFMALGALRPTPEQKPSASSRIEVLTESAAVHQGGFEIQVDGVVVPYRDVEIAAEVPGRVEFKDPACRAGNYVIEGTVLYRIDDRDYQLNVTRLQQELAQAQVSVVELEEEITGTEELIRLADEEVALRKRELQRQRNLSNVVSAEAIERAEGNELAARNQRRTLQNKLNLLNAGKARLSSMEQLKQSQLEQAELDLGRTTIVAPLDGVIVRDLVEAGAHVQMGTPLVVIEDTSRAEVSCKLEMDDLYWLWNQAGAADATMADAYRIPNAEQVQVVYQMQVDRTRTFRWDGRLARYDGVGLDEMTRTMPVRIVVDEPRQAAPGGPPALVRGMFVSVRIHVQPTLPLLRIPATALRPGNRVWRVRDGQLTIVPVHYVRSLAPDTGSDTAADQDADRHVLIHVDVSDDLRPGDQLVVSPLAFVSSGMAVQVKPLPEEAP